ncbi:MAG TPA: hypothetical protein VK171_02915, partial [Fimbriimonas sp.]|nr:hypothetical protein [Fimbriimonas sp.]
MALMTTDPNRSAVLQVVNSVPPVLAGYTDGLAQASNNKLVANDLISQAKEGVTLFDRAQDLVAARARTPVPSRTGGVFAGIPVMQDEFWKEVYGTGKPSERAEDPGLQEAPKFGDQIALGDSASRRGGPRLVAGAPQEEWETLQSKLEEILGQRAQVQPQSIDLSGVIQALRDRNVAMPKLPDLAKSRLTDSERVATILAGLLGGGATGVAQASNAAWAGAGQRAQRENAERE